MLTGATLRRKSLSHSCFPRPQKRLKASFLTGQKAPKPLFRSGGERQTQVKIKTKGMFVHLCTFLEGSGDNGSSLQYSCLENPMDGGAWWAAVHGVAKSRTQLSDFTFTFHFHALEKEMATHSSVLAWRIPGTGEPGGLPSMGSHRVGHD